MIDKILLYWIIGGTAMIVLYLLRGFLFGVLCTASHIAGCILDVACQAWIDISGLFRRKVKLDEHEKEIS